MRTAKDFLSVVVIGLAVTLPAPVIAATAHNSQAGAYGSTKNNCAATPYFPADSGCLGSYVQGKDDDGIFPPPAEVRSRYRPRPPLQ